ncbi:heme/copper-type cytochrome/quinol oxidase, subunit 4 (plasmid) [Hoeflea sp. IMCC20628]|uniref:cytochrome o ubiquinol oxidase subunit IV n=1 Tax=Hoeflea sp. IMCC20628 TaxID=1620421 RepID=UPI00063ABB5F|nr:cytochrome o ubiquinol oxidase subunit IV [Hoeflea sp. IMCC20628]AKI03531.1 heme/copper-type cytochrome/quinol oxidase, subunit 4 [Hoeflea sp. IMCC20628]
MSEPNYQQEVRGYLTGFGLALVLTLVPFALVLRGDLSPLATLIVLGGCGLAQFVVQLRFFLHIDLRRQKREDLQLILFSVLLLVIMAGGTIWIIGNLGMRM